MKSIKSKALLASVGAIALLLTVNEAPAASGATSRGGHATSHQTSHRLAAHMFRNHHRGAPGAVWWPGYDDSFYGTYGAYGPGGPMTETPPASGESTNTNGIPWDWAHRYPPMVRPTERPYVSNCPAETVTVPDGRGGKGEVNIMRCY